MLKMVAQSIASTSSPQRETRIRASKVGKFNLLWKWLLIAFCSENPLSQIAILDGMNLIFYQSCISLGQFVRPFQIATTYVPSLIYCFAFTHVEVFLEIPRVVPCTCHILLQCIKTSTLSFRATIMYLWFGHYHCLDNNEGWKVWMHCTMQIYRLKSSCQAETTTQPKWTKIGLGENYPK